MLDNMDFPPFPCIRFNSDFIKEFGRFCLADPLTTLHRGLLSRCVVALHRLVSWHCIAVYRGIVSPCIVAYYLHIILVRMIVWFKRMIESNSQNH